jgi:hypothetical protein
MAADGGFEDNEERRALRHRLAEYTEEHRALDEAIYALHLTGTSDQLQLARLKKRKLHLRDQIKWIEDQLMPDIIA